MNIDFLIYIEYLFSFGQSFLLKIIYCLDDIVKSTQSLRYQAFNIYTSEHSLVIFMFIAQFYGLEKIEYFFT